MVPNTRCVATSSMPNGASKVALAMSSVEGSFLVMAFRGLPLAHGLVGERREALADLGLIGGVDSGDHNPGPARQAVQHHAPRIHDHRMTVGFAAVHVISALGGGDHVG